MRPGHLTNEPYDGYIPVGIYGWRKRCLYAFILLLMIIVIMNLALTVWILRVLDFSIGTLNPKTGRLIGGGMGKLRIMKDGIRVDGQSEFSKTLYTSNINAPDNQPLIVESSRNITLQARDKRDVVTNTLVIGDKKIESTCEKFSVKDKKGRERLSITDGHVQLYHNEFIHKGESIFDGSIETPTVRSPKTKPLIIEAPESYVKLVGHSGVNVISLAGKVDFKSSKEIVFHSSKASISLDAKGIYLKNMKISSSTTGGSDPNLPKVHQLCMCDTGRLFLASPTQECEATAELCRR
ncbi:unnamed protein product [Acanthosepion pharaonis]|uniref:Zeta-sarcoglycan n=1 Tax=Acanthosepion pharaonis TaxID=158019 RepID=A0A812ASG3_ACAPH|nr:unnamed protein product [Sepia pharaonis]